MILSRLSRKTNEWSKHCFSQLVEHCARQLEIRQTSVTHYQCSSTDWLQSSILQQTALSNPVLWKSKSFFCFHKTFEKTVDEIKLIVQKPKCFLSLISTLEIRNVSKLEVICPSEWNVIFFNKCNNAVKSVNTWIMFFLICLITAIAINLNIKSLQK